jgi:D-hydroxyproline dehydrogenase subunit gamma
MPEQVVVRVNGSSVAVPAGATVAVAILISAGSSRWSVTGEPRAPLCGMGTCFECRATINGEAQQRSCQLICEPGMEIDTRG